MSLHAIDDISDAIDATKAFLLPFALRTWLKLAVVVFFITGGGGGFTNFPSSGNFGGEGGSGSGPDPVAADGSVPTTLDGIVAAVSVELLVIVALAVLLVLLFGLLSNFMEFVFVQSLVSREVHVRRYLGRHVGNGLRLFVFRTLLSLGTLALVAGAAYAVFVTTFGGSMENITVESLFPLLLLAIGAFFLVSVVLGLVNGFTNVFVVPMMVTGDRGLLGSWKRLLGSMRRNLKQYLAYLVFSIILALGIGIVAGTVAFVAALALGIPVFIVAMVVLSMPGHGLVGVALVVLVGLLALLLLLLVTSFANVPLQAFLRYYAMLVLGDIDESLDPIPELRADIRPADGTIDDTPDA